MSRKCKNNPNLFCYICDEYTLPCKKRNPNRTISDSNKFYFRCQIGDQDRVCPDNICYLTCTANLSSWSKGIKCLLEGTIGLWN